jgi:hypothetical protein
MQALTLNHVSTLLTRRRICGSLIALLMIASGCMQHTGVKLESRSRISVDQPFVGLGKADPLARVQEHLEGQGYQVTRKDSLLRASKTEVREAADRTAQVDLTVDLRTSEDWFNLHVEGHAPSGLKWQHERRLTPWESNAAAEIRTQIRAIEDIVSLPRFN